LVELLPKLLLRYNSNGGASTKVIVALQ